MTPNTSATSADNAPRVTTHPMAAPRKLCWHCKRRHPEPGYKTCQVCRRQVRKRMRRERRERTSQGLCTVCGEQSPEPGKRRCADCARKRREQAIETQENRLLDGVCVQCGKRAPARDRLRCKVCLRKQRERRRGSSDTSSAERVARWKAKQRAAGRCTTCGELTETNPRTDQPYGQCALHRRKARRSRALLRDSA